MLHAVQWNTIIFETAINNDRVFKQIVLNNIIIN